MWVLGLAVSNFGFSGLRSSGDYGVYELKSGPVMLFNLRFNLRKVGNGVLTLTGPRLLL